MRAYREVLITAGILASIASASVATAVTPVPLRAVLEADDATLALIPSEGILSTCTDALSSEREPATQAEIRIRRGWAHLAQGRPAEAQADFEWVLNRFPDHVVARRWLAECCYRRGDLAEAARLLRELAGKDSASAASRSALAELYAKSGDMASALSVASEGLLQDPDNVQLLYIRALGYLAKNDYDSCLHDLAAALTSVLPDAASLAAAMYAARGSALLAKGRPEAAEYNLQVAVSIDGTVVRHLALRCGALLARERNGLALLVANRLETHPGIRSDLVAVRNCATAYLLAGEFRKAAEYAYLWRAMEPANTFAFAVAGLAELGCREYARSRASLEQALELDQGNTGALGGLVFVLAFHADDQQSSSQRALEYGQRLIPAAKDPQRAWGLMAFVHMARGERPEAVACLRKSLEPSGKLSPSRRSVALRMMSLLEESRALPAKEELASDAWVFVQAGNENDLQVEGIPLQAVLEADNRQLELLPAQPLISLCNLALRDAETPESQAELRLRRGWTLLRLRRYSEARSDFEWLANQFPEGNDARHWLAESLRVCGDSTAARHAFEDLLEDARPVESYVSLASLYLDSDEIHKAMNVATDGLYEDPLNVRLLHMRAMAHYNADNLDACIGDLNRALRVDSPDAAWQQGRMYALRGCALMAKGDLKAAEANLRMALKLDNNNAEHVGHLCQVFIKSRRIGLAAWMAGILDREPWARSAAPCVKACAAAFLLDRQYERALEYARLWVNIEPSSSDALLVCGLAALACNQHALARDSLERSLAAKGNSQRALVALAFVLAFHPDHQQRDAAGARECASRACQGGGTSARSLAMLGFVQGVSGDRAAAADCLRRCLVTAATERNLTPEQHAACERALELLEQSAGLQSAELLLPYARALAL